MKSRGGSVKRAAAVALLLVLAVSCQMKRTEWGGCVKVSEAGWPQQAPVRVNLPVEDSLASYRLSVLLRHTNRYLYTGIWLTASIYGPDGTRFSCDTLHLELADAHGRWTGRGWGDLYTAELPWGRKAVRFPRCGTYQFGIWHVMPDRSLQGVYDVTVRMTKQQR